MKKTIVLLSILALLSLAAGCKKNQEELPIGTTQTTASEEETTKATVSEAETDITPTETIVPTKADSTETVKDTEVEKVEETVTQTPVIQSQNPDISGETPED